ncbi:MAG: hypothetical protein SGILL_007386 [Bacillariaceae sp.]
MAAPTRKNSKAKVQEIDGLLWQVDEKGNPLKKLRKKPKPGEDEKHRPSSPHKKATQEIDGHVWEVDGKGKPIKKLRKKGDKGNSPGISKSSKSMDNASKSSHARTTPKPSSRSLDNDVPKDLKRGLSMRKIKYEPVKANSSSGGSVGGHGRSTRSKSRERGSGRSRSPGKQRARSRSRGRDGCGESVASREPRPGQRRRGSMGNHGPSSASSGHPPLGPGETAYTDDKGRRVVIDADGNKIAFDKNGKKLRPKKKSDPLNVSARSSGGNDDTDPIALLEMRRELQAAKEEVERMKQQSQQDQEKISKATHDMERLKKEHDQAEQEKRQMDLQVKNFKRRLKDQEETLANMPKLNRDGSNAASAGGDHLVSQITTLMDENNILLEKLAKEKAAAAEELGRKEDELRFLKMELQKLRDENDQLFRNQGSDANPMVDKLLDQKKEVEAKLTSRIEKLQDRVEVLQKNNEVLNEDLTKATLEIHEDDDEETRKAKLMAQAVVETKATKSAQKAKRASMLVNNGMSPHDAALGASNALRMIYRGGRQNTNQGQKKAWF